MKEPKVAVVIPAKNAEKTLEKAFVSVLNQKTEEQIETALIPLMEEVLTNEAISLK